jgi:hypothetical protein
MKPTVPSGLNTTMPASRITTEPPRILKERPTSLAPLVAKLRNYMKWSLSGERDTVRAVGADDVLLQSDFLDVALCVEEYLACHGIDHVDGDGEGVPVVLMIDTGSVSLNCSGAAACGGNL